MAVLILIEHPEEREKYEDMNYAAAKGLPMNELAEWYISHAKQIVNKQTKNANNNAQKLNPSIA